jgi:hypothetical protein
MVLFKGFRARAEQKFEDDLGAEPPVVALAALALHPFTAGSAVPKNRELTKLVRSGSSQFARTVRAVRTPDELLALARATVQPWHWAARQVEDKHYAKVFGDALDATAKDGDNFGVVFGSDPHLMARLKEQHGGW